MLYTGKTRSGPGMDRIVACGETFAQLPGNCFSATSFLIPRLIKKAFILT
jgi:hypothetical protein